MMMPPRNDGHGGQREQHDHAEELEIGADPVDDGRRPMAAAANPKKNFDPVVNIAAPT